MAHFRQDSKTSAHLLGDAFKACAAGVFCKKSLLGMNPFTLGKLPEAISVMRIVLLLYSVDTPY